MLHVFDLDHTLLKTNGSFSFGVFLYRKKKISFSQCTNMAFAYFRHKYFGMSFEKLHQMVFDIFLKDSSKNTWETLAEEFFRVSFSDLIYLPTLKCLWKAKERGKEVLILSSSPDFLVSAFARCLVNVPWKATEYLTDHEGKIKKIGVVMDGVVKARSLMDYLNDHPHNQEQIVVYTDNLHDLPLIQMAGTVKIVRPNYKLAKECRKNKWEIIT